MSLRITRRQALLAGAALSAASADAANTLERWGLVEIALDGPAAGNPFLDAQLSAEFRFEHRAVEVAGFYDGNGVYKIRFMPDAEGAWSYRTRSNRPALDGKTGSFVCGKRSAGNHGPVGVRNTYRFGYADGTPFYQFGTTCYAWTHQGDALEEQTLATLRTAPFNKIRMCVFPKWYAYNRAEPPAYAFPRNAAGENDTSRFEPLFFQRLERRVAQLSALGIEADIILFHPYDNPKWGYSDLPAEVNDRYLRYVVARLAAYRNVWWSMANEWDLVKSKTLADWDRFFRIVQESDPYQHLRSIHHSRVMYDHAKPWVTHASIQGDAFEKVGEWREAFRKPIVFDECKYEGNIPRRWGDIAANEMVRRFWLGTTLGAWVGHGETYLDPNDVLWWAKGGKLKGESALRIAYLRKLIESSGKLDPAPGAYPCLARQGEEYLFYFDYHRPAEYAFELPADGDFRAELIDPWQMRTTPFEGRYRGKAELKLPGEPYLAVRFWRA